MNSIEEGALAQKLERVRKLLIGCERVMVAMSAGVDSTLLAKLARDVLGKENMLAVTADSPSIAKEELEVARQLARQLDIDHIVVQTGELRASAYRENPKDRCYFCKRELFEELGKIARARRIPVVLYGAISDDRNDYRPGERAAMERNVRAPLQEAGLAKWEVRKLAQALGLPNWNRPQNACLASRIPHGQEVSEEKLERIEQAESFLHKHGFNQVRVRHVGMRARIEVDPDSVSRFYDPIFSAHVRAQFQALGFEQIWVSREGYRRGGADLESGNELLLSAES